ncbi:hypothetical protein CDL15_Pgr001294 [Punica granatum]|uniref:Uncharacterized protein n=1 Tax=Punica granatum TaxID=22663 RepID=A0A218WLE4_PUNGR|nr:hypothetical protein CDL15_Pgr001294 [Punica granatum]
MAASFTRDWASSAGGWREKKPRCSPQSSPCAVSAMHHVALNSTRFGYTWFDYLLRRWP